jgi:hypothetical protein
MAPAVAASGLPVTAIQWRPCSGGFCVVTGKLLNDCDHTVKLMVHIKTIELSFFMRASLG